MDRKDANAPAAGSWKKRVGMLASATAVVAVIVALRFYGGAGPASADDPQAPMAQRNGFLARTANGKDGAAAANANADPESARKLAVMAQVNGKDVSRQDLANACVLRFGKEVQDSLINKYLIAQHMEQHHVTISRGEIQAEIDTIAKRFKLGTQQWLQMLEKERGVNPEQYARDIIWPTLALRKLAAHKVVPTEEEIIQEHEAEFGAAVQTRMIAVKDAAMAEQLRQQVIAQPDDFAKLAREHSVDPASASAGGLLQPIRKHMGTPEVEQAVFSLNEGDVSEVVKIGEQFAVFRCEKQIPQRNVALADVQEHLAERVKERKLRDAAGGIFEQVQKGADVVNIWPDPQKTQQTPGVAAIVNGHRISMLELSEECLLRHGRDVLEGEINRMLLEQELAKANVEVTQADLDAEIANAAILAGYVDGAGQPDLKSWVDMVMKQQEVSYDIYVRDAVWPSAALKKLVAAGVKVNDDDMSKGFEANFGPRVRCRAIVMTNLRRAQEVWNMARQNPSIENFGKLAKQYSIEGSSAQFDGEVPPIRKHGGQPVLEKEAFALQPGELSGVIQVGENFVILLCEGFTEPVKVNLAEVQDGIYRDLLEKKTRIAMAQRFDKVRDDAQIDNYLAGTTQSPKKLDPNKQSEPRTARVPATAGQPGPTLR